MILKNALVINLNNDNMHLLGLTPSNFYNPRIEYSKFFALRKILRNVPKDDDGFKWLKVPENNYADFIGFNIIKYKAGFKFHTKYAMAL